MSYSNDFKAFAIGSGANVETPTTWSGDSVVNLGFQSGTALSIKFNTVLRQASSMAQMIGDFTAQYGPGNVQDNGNITTLQTQFISALGGLLGNGIFKANDTGTANAVAIVVPNITLGAGQCFLVKKSTSVNTGATTINLNGLGAISVVWADGTALIAGDWPASVTGLVEYDGAQFNLLSFIGPSILGRVTTVPLNYYVNSATGNDANPGLTLGLPFASVQRAINVASIIRTINTQITINVANGTYSNFTFSNVVGCSINLVGNTGSPSSCIINTNGSGTFSCDISNQASISISGFQFNGLGGGIRAKNLSLVSVASCIFNTSGNQVNSAYGLYAVGSSVITATGPLTISNASASFIVAGQRSTIALDNQTITASAASFTIVAGTAGYYAWANGGAITASNVTFAGSGVSYGQRLEVDSGGAVYTGTGASGTLTYFPGTIAAVVATGCYAG